MTSQRITADIRDALIRAAKNKRYGAEREAMTKANQELNDRVQTVGKEIYYSLFSKANLELIDKIPADWLPKECNVRVSVEGVGVKQVDFFQQLPVPKSWSSYNNIAAVIKPDHFCLAAMEELKAARAQQAENEKDLKEREDRLGFKVRAVIESVTTTGRLKEIWPEVTELLELDSQPAGAMLPAINLKDLNAEIGIGSH